MTCTPMLIPDSARSAISGYRRTKNHSSPAHRHNPCPTCPRACASASCGCISVSTKRTQDSRKRSTSSSFYERVNSTGIDSSLVLARRYADRAVEPHALAVEVAIRDHQLGQGGVFHGLPEPLRERDRGCKARLHALGRALQVVSCTIPPGISPRSQSDQSLNFACWSAV